MLDDYAGDAEAYPPVKLIRLEDRIVPDNTFDESYAIYFQLSYEPPLHWQEAFENLMKREVEPRVVSFIGPSLRVVITRMDYLENVMRQVNAVVIQTNETVGF